MRCFITCVLSWHRIVAACSFQLQFIIILLLQLVFFTSLKLSAWFGVYCVGRANYAPCEYTCRSGKKTLFTLLHRDADTRIANGLAVPCTPWDGGAMWTNSHFVVALRTNNRLCDAHTYRWHVHTCCTRTISIDKQERAGSRLALECNILSLVLTPWAEGVMSTITQRHMLCAAFALKKTYCVQRMQIFFVSKFPCNYRHQRGMCSELVELVQQFNSQQTSIIYY